MDNEYKRYIRIITNKEIKNKDKKKCFAIIKRHIPNNVLTHITRVENQTPKKKNLIHKRKGNKHIYDFILKRDPHNEELDEISFDLVDETSFDFYLEGSDYINSILRKKFEDLIRVDNESIRNLAEKMAKVNHKQWKDKLINDGWSYGLNYSRKNKTHPLLVSWENLPEKYKDIDDESPQKLIDILRDEGYCVIKKEDLEQVLNSYDN